MIRIERNSDQFRDVLPVFAMGEFLSARSEEYGWFVDDNFVLPFIIDKRLIFRRLVITNEPICLNDFTVETERHFMEQVFMHCEKEMRVDFIAKPQANAVFRTVPDSADIIEWGSYIVDLRNVEIDMIENFHPKHRNSVKKAIKEGVKVEVTEDLESVYQNIKCTFLRQKELVYPTKDYLLKLITHLPDNIRLYTATLKGELQGSAIIAFNKHGGYYYYGGSKPGPSSGSMNLLQYELMRDLQIIQIPQYDLMGARIDVDEESKFAGIQKFKARFGGELRKGYSFRKIIKPCRYKLFNWSVGMYYLMKGSRYKGDAIDQISAHKRKKSGKA